MERVILMLIFVSFNTLCTIWMYKRERYKAGVVSGFATGVCFMGLLDAIYDL